MVCDLDGVVYRGDVAVPGAADALRRAEAAGWRILFVTNNSARSASYVVAKLAGVAGYEATIDQVVTSSMAAVTLVEEGPVLVVGESGLTEAVESAGWELTDDPVRARSVIVGLDRDLTYQKISRAATAVRSGARFIATNRDATYPAATSLEPGAGSMVAAVETAAGAVATAAGKPEPAMRKLLAEHTGPGPVWVIGDRADTDIALASGTAGWRSVLVLTGVTAAAAGTVPTADLVAPDLPAAVGLVLGQ